MKINLQKGNILIPVSIAVFLFGLLLGFLIFSDNSYKNNSGKITKLQKPEFVLTRPLLDCGDDTFSFRQASKRKEEVQKIIDKAKKEKDIAKASVYFFDLNSGRWFGFNEREEFYSASLIKVLILMTYLKEAEENPELLNSKILYSQQLQSLLEQVDYPPEMSLKEGEEYTILELLERTIVYSDNQASELLSINREDILTDISKIFEDLGIEATYKMDDRMAVDILFSAQEYTRVFRILYNATYLSHKSSEKALEILSKVEYNEGIAAGTKEGTVIANKFGERSFLFATGNVIKKQLHDCGIVYHENGPYVLCIMTQGKDNTKLQSFIKEISHKIFTMQYNY